MSKLDFDEVSELFSNGRFVKYNPQIALLSGSNNVAILLGYLLFWNGLGSNKNCTYKTINQMYEETGLSKHQQASAIKFCVEKGFLKVELKSIPRKRHFYLEVSGLKNWITEHPEYGKTVSRYSDVQQDDNGSTITESYKENLEITYKVYELYLRLFSKNEQECRLTTRRRSMISERIKDLGLEGTVAAVRGAADDEYWNGANEEARVATFEVVFKEYERAEGFANKWEGR